ncbi:unnamed protein product [Rodentolepis nana]|uniref:Uncharacterized protein n=1 Tax=Rodentolepis nana TaxID=102285 RepID=A0A3P7VCR6_RODNA|nr:unnamed protein product [Rodentolepis nana]
MMPTIPRSSLKHKRKSTNPVKRLSLPASRSSDVVDKSSKSRQRKTSVSRKSALRKRVPSGGGKGKKQECSVRKTGEEKDESCSPPHPSVTETPNPKASLPRWERARMAAAAKIKNKKVIVAESPLKPTPSGNVIGSPLRRLRRASSFLNFGGNNEASQSSSNLGARAERYQRRLQEEETSLSQFSGGGESNSQCTQPLSASNSCSDLRRRSSNLLVNFASPKKPTKPTLQSVVSSPSILTSLKRKSVRPFRHLFGDDPTSSTALERRESASKRQRIDPEGGSIAQPRISREFSENAMFLGEDEFLLHTNTPPRMRTRGMDAHISPRRESGVLSPSKGEGGVPVLFKTPTKNLRSAASMRQASEQESQSDVHNRRTPTRSQSLLSGAPKHPPTRILRSGLTGQREASALDVPTVFQSHGTPTRSQSLLPSSRPESPFAPKTPTETRSPGPSLRRRLKFTPDHQTQENSETHKTTRKRPAAAAQFPSHGGNQSPPKTPTKKQILRSPISPEAGGTSLPDPSE